MIRVRRRREGCAAAGESIIVSGESLVLLREHDPNSIGSKFPETEQMDRFLVFEQMFQSFSCKKKQSNNILMMRFPSINVLLNSQSIDNFTRFLIK